MSRERPSAAPIRSMVAGVRLMLRRTRNSISNHEAAGQGSRILQHQKTTLAGLLVLGTLTASTASAQIVYIAPSYVAPRYYASDLPLSEIMRIVRSAGFAPLSAPVRRGPNYVLAAADRAGGQVRVIVNAYVAQIVSVRPVIALHPLSPPAATSPYAAPPLADGSPRVAAPPSVGAAPVYGRGEPPVSGQPSVRIDYGTLPLPSPGFTDPRPANVAPAVPVPTPLPRPRPTVAANDAPAGSIAARASSRAASTASGDLSGEAPVPAAQQATKPPVQTAPVTPFE